MKAAYDVKLKKANLFVYNAKINILIQLLIIIKVNVSNAKMDVTYVGI